MTSQKRHLFRGVLLACILHIPSFIPSARAYWQQHVSYDIRVTLVDSMHTLDGDLSVVYTNHSPDTLREVYFHLYSNAFQPGSMMDERALAIHSAPVYDRIHKLPESEWGKYWIDHISVDEQAAQFEITGTIMRVGLAKPLAPGDSVTIAFPFREQIPKQIRRSGWMSPEGVEYSMAQWYPKIAEYDFEGWQRQEYIAREFYGVYGEFNVQMTLPSRYTVGATGQCMNPTEVGHGYDQIATGTKAGLVESSAAPGMTTWKFHADHVHDFAWVADDDYIHEWMTWNDTTTIHAFYKQWARHYWEKNALAYSLFALSTYSHDFGPYAYRNFSCTMAGDGGMEYPQLIMITGYRPNPLSLAGVIAHEVGHQWFYGMLGSNETRQAFMDEGFTTFATTLSMNALFGDNQEYPGEEHSWLDWFVPKFSNKRDNYRFYQEIASQGYDEPLDIPHDWFREDATAGLVYGKTAAILNMLEYTLGDSTFFAGMREYYSEWRFKHPHLLDFQRVMEKVSHTDLAWFFDEWFNTTRTVDYEATNVSSTPSLRRRGQGGGPADSTKPPPNPLLLKEGEYVTTVKLHNNGLGVMPLDLLLHFSDGTSEAATIPLATNQGLDYHKDGISHFFPSWDWVAPNYTGSLITPKPVSWFEIDTSWRLQDLNWLNNYSPRGGLWAPPGAWAVWKQLFVNPPIDKYYAVARPIVWYEAISGVDAGAGLKFGMNNGFSGDAKIIYRTASKPNDVTSLLYYNKLPTNWYDPVDGAIQFSTSVDWFGRLNAFSASASKLYGIGEAKVALSKVFRPVYWRLGPTHEASIFLETDRRLNSNFPVYHTGWSDGITNVAGIRYSIVSENRNERFDALGETSILGSNHYFSLLKAKFEAPIVLPFDIASHLRLAMGTATAYTPYERQFWLDRSNNYEEQSSGFFRAVTGIDPQGLGSDGAMFVEGGAGLRGYNASHYDPSLDPRFAGTNMLGANYDLAIPNPLSSLGNIPRSFSFGIFTDAGWIGNDLTNAWSDIRRNLRTDAGFKIGVDILSWLPSQLRGVAEEYASIPTVNLYWPMYENHPTDGTPNFGWRWAISLGEAF